MHFLRVLVSGSTCSGCLGVADEYENWILREILFFLGAMLGSTVGTVHASTLTFGSISHIFFVAADSNPDCVSSPFGLNGEECPVDASGCSFAPRSSHLEYWTSFSSSTLLTPVMMVWIFRRIFTAFFGLLFGVEAPGCQFMPRLVDINLPRDGRV